MDTTMLAEDVDSIDGTTTLIVEDVVGLVEDTEVVVEAGTAEMMDIKRSTMEDILLQLITVIIEVTVVIMMPDMILEKN